MPLKWSKFSTLLNKWQAVATEEAATGRAALATGNTAWRAWLDGPTDDSAFELGAAALDLVRYANRGGEVATLREHAPPIDRVIGIWAAEVERVVRPRWRADGRIVCAVFDDEDDPTPSEVWCFDDDEAELIAEPPPTSLGASGDVVGDALGRVSGPGWRIQVTGPVAAIDVRGRKAAIGTRVGTVHILEWGVEPVGDQVAVGPVREIRRWLVWPDVPEPQAW